MKKILSFIAFIAISSLFAQSTTYTISFENAAHHEANIKATYNNLSGKNLDLRMSRTSPGRYAIHDFAKNVYGVKAVDSKGNSLKIARKNTQVWTVLNHDGTVTFSYTLFANRGDGTYSQIDETHAHLNIPSVFIYAPSLSDKNIEATFVPRTDLGWKVATQLQHKKGNTYTAPNLQYFMDSPTEVSNHSVRKFDVDGKTIEFVLHDTATEAELDTYFEKVKKIVLAEKAVFGELPNFDYNRYTFLACYIANASGDGMEHRNSTILTSTRGLANGGMNRNLGTVSHELFHAWNVERIRPQSLEPFNFEESNMSGELWFAEGFTSYYTNLILCRAGLMTPKKYVKGLAGGLNYVWNSPARQFFNPIEMSYQAPFVDAATALDPVNRNNTFISYYTYGSVLGLALDLSLREKGLNLDDYMKLVWNTYGKKEIPYTIDNLHQTLNTFAGKSFADDFFNNYIYNSSKIPDYNSYFNAVGVTISQNTTTAYLGAYTKGNKIATNATIGSPAYIAGLEKGDVVTKINETILSDENNIKKILANFKSGDTFTLAYTRHNTAKKATIILTKNPKYTTSLSESPSKKELKNRNDWLKR